MTRSRARQFFILLIVAAGLAMASTGCGDFGSDDSASLASSSGFGDDPGNQSTGTVPGEQPSAGVSQGGAQDFGAFKAILEAGDIPGPDTLDDVGFFNEHKLTWPSADCGQDLCIHGLLGVAGNMLNGANCTLVTIGLNTPINPANIPRPPLDLVLAIDTSGSMAGDNITFVRQGLLQMLESLSEEDHVSIITYDSHARLLVHDLAATHPDLRDAIVGLNANGRTNLFDGIRLAFETLLEQRTADRAPRVIILSDGLATAGVTVDARIRAMVSTYTDLGIGITTIGLGTEFNVDLMRELSEQGSGNFYFLESPEAVVEVFTEEVKTFLLALAEDAQIRFKVSDGYTLRQIYGTQLATLTDNTGTINIPSLFIAHRTSTNDNVNGRRGGGGGMVVELTPAANPGAGFDPNNVGELILDYRVPGTDTRLTQRVNITSELQPGDTPDNGLFDNPTVEKAFVMLNIYVGFRIAASSARAGANEEAIGVLQRLRTNVTSWLETNDDPDIRDDLRYIDLFIDNLRMSRSVNPTQVGQAEITTITIPPPPTERWVDWGWD